MNINAITPSFKGNLKFTTSSSGVAMNRDSYTKTENIEIPADKIVSYREKQIVYSGDKNKPEITTQITDLAGKKYLFDLPLETVKESVEKATQTPNETVELPKFIGMA